MPGGLIRGSLVIAFFFFGSFHHRHLFNINRGSIRRWRLPLICLRLFIKRLEIRCMIMSWGSKMDVTIMFLYTDPFIRRTKARRKLGAAGREWWQVKGYGQFAWKLNNTLSRSKDDIWPIHLVNWKLRENVFSRWARRNRTHHG